MLSTTPTLPSEAVVFLTCGCYDLPEFPGKPFTACELINLKIASEYDGGFLAHKGNRCSLDTLLSLSSESALSRNFLSAHCCWHPCCPTSYGQFLLWRESNIEQTA